MTLDKESAYLIGLMCGRGHIILRDKKIIVEFAHKNETAYGIAYCPKCGGLATSSRDDESDELTCKLCKNKVSKSVKKIYEQKKSTINSIKDTITPFLSNKFKINYDIVGNDHMTLLIMDFTKDNKGFSEIISLFSNKTGFDSFEIPKILTKSIRESKIEFVNGLMDTSGFFNSGSWMPREGKSGFGIMRGYFQIVRNWKMPVQILDFLKDEFSLNIQTIDWGHPNMRDQENIYAWIREHQIKFFPENYDIFKPKIKHKQEMFEELVLHNKKVGSANEESFGISPINEGQIKPYHPAENDPRLPKEIRGIHFDASWQIALRLGSKIINEEYKKAKYKSILYLTGEDENLVYSKKIKEFEKIRHIKTIKAKINRKEIEQELFKREKRRIRTNPEQRLYSPISKYLEKLFSKRLGEKVLFYDTSSFYLNKFISESEIGKELEYYDQYKIKPDLVGFVRSSKRILMAEIKATELSLKDLGQLRGYCLVANPEYAILISDKEPSLNLKKILKFNRNVLSYMDKTIKIARWNGKKMNVLKL